MILSSVSTTKTAQTQNIIYEIFYFYNVLIEHLLFI